MYFAPMLYLKMVNLRINIHSFKNIHLFLQTLTTQPLLKYQRQAPFFHMGVIVFSKKNVLKEVHRFEHPKMCVFNKTTSI